jgi:spore maturation protein CgeB
VATGIHQSGRNRPGSLQDPNAQKTRSQEVGEASISKAVSSGHVSAADVAQKVFDAAAANHFYIYSHPKALKSVQTRMEDIVQARNPTSPFADKPGIGEELKRALRG